MSLHSLLFIALIGVTLLPTLELPSSFKTRPSQSGSLSGYVYNSDGSPLANADVLIEVLNNEPFVGQRPQTSTDINGKFTISVAQPGLIRLHAFKETDGYPDTSSYLYKNANGSPLEVLLSSGQIIEGIVIKLGSKRERLHLTVVDAETNSTLKKATISIHSKENPSVRSSMSSDEKGNFEILLPTIPASLKVRTQGYQDAEILDIQSLTKPPLAQAKASKEYEITISLRRK